ncbi:hypothetical protein [Plantactinospora sp. B5E13]|uniref:hypothetical protein n=1 Tax=unclassified Plantactinospora TaxID=2631981 RepID=UPI00325D7D25
MAPAVAAASVTLVTAASLSACESTGAAQQAGEQCPTPTAAAVREHASRAAAVFRATIEEQPLITDGVTTTRGLVARVDGTLAGAGVPERVAVWPGVDTPAESDLLGVGTVLVVFARPHDRPTTVDGTPLPGYDITGTNALLSPVPEGVVRICKGGRSAPAAASVLDEV